MCDKDKPSTKLLKVIRTIVKALKDLKRPQGCTLDDIVKYFEIKNGKVRKWQMKKINAALSRGISFGAIKKRKNFYKLDPIMALTMRCIKCEGGDKKRKTTKRFRRCRR